MSEFNLLNEPWISVMTDSRGTTKEVSLLELFENAHKYKRLAGETPAQDFAVLRFLLAIMYTVFSRFDYEGDTYEYIELNDMYLNVSELDEDDEDDYAEAVLGTWKKLWKSEKFPSIISKYLEKWGDRFNLFDEAYPFYQVTKNDLEKHEVTKTGEIKFKFINRMLSESNNKVELFSPYSENYKNELGNPSLVRWLIAFQGYTGTADKAKFPNMSVSASKGWLLGLGGIYLEGANLKETLLLNMSLVKISASQTPIWEKDFVRKINDLMGKLPTNLAELYTNWSRLVRVVRENGNPSNILAVQLPGINPQEFFLEPMTIWRYAKSGNDKDHFIPKTHNENQSFWRSFGSLALQSESQSLHKPELIDWHNKLVKEKYLENSSTDIVAVGLNYNRDASTMPNGEIYDELKINDMILADIKKDGWVDRISDEIILTQRVIEQEFKMYLQNIKKIRNLSNDGFVDTLVQEAYFLIDEPFRDWLSSLTVDHSKEEKVKEWREKLKGVIKTQARKLLENAGKRDYLGLEIDKVGYINVEISYNRLMFSLNKILD